MSYSKWCVNVPWCTSLSLAFAMNCWYWSGQLVKSFIASGRSNLRADGPKISVLLFGHLSAYFTFYIYFLRAFYFLVLFNYLFHFIPAVSMWTVSVGDMSSTFNVYGYTEWYLCFSWDRSCLGQRFTKLLNPFLTFTFFPFSSLFL